MDNANEVLMRLAAALDVRTDAAVARAMEVSPQTLANHRKRGSLPYEQIISLAERKGFSLDHIFFGKGGPTTIGAGIDTTLLTEVSYHLSKSPKMQEMSGREFAYYAALVYNQALHVSDKTTRTGVILGAVTMLTQVALPAKEELMDYLENDDSLEQRVKAIKRLMESSTSASQVVQGDSNQVAGRDVVNDGSRKKGKK